MKYTRKRNRRRIVRGGEKSPKVDRLTCCEKAVFRVMDKLLPHKPPGSRNATHRGTPRSSATPRGTPRSSATPRGTPRSSYFPRRSTVNTQPGTGMGTKRRRKKKKIINKLK